MNQKIPFKKVVEKILSPNEEIKYQFSIGERYLKIKKIITILMGSIILLIIGLFLYFQFGFGIITIELIITTIEIAMINIILVLIACLVLLIGFSFFYFDWLLKRLNIYIITNKRIIIHKGWFSTDLKSIGFEQIADIKILQSFFEKIFFKTGTLKIDTAGTNEVAIILYHIENPYQIKTKIIDIKYSLSGKN